MTSDLLAEQIAYYRERAPEYDRWWERSHQYQLPPEEEAIWRGEIEQLEATIDGWLEGAPGRRVLELACGTGLWTVRLAAWADELTAVDAAPEAIEINRAKLAAPRARTRFVEADLFDWEPPAGAFDVVFFSFWVSHVPPQRFNEFWALVDRALTPDGVAIFIDNRWGDGIWPPRDAPRGPVQTRTDLSSGRIYRVVKVYYEPDELAEKLDKIGWQPDVTATSRHFVMGRATRPGRRTGAP
jgi:SAM-dependent methyltransferase